MIRLLNSLLLTCICNVQFGFLSSLLIFYNEIFSLFGPNNHFTLILLKPLILCHTKNFLVKIRRLGITGHNYGAGFRHTCWVDDNVCV